ncbi:MAG TPA: ABC transporter permease [Candidatus Aphodomonas merdavium]|nr:ABC transporter permease [Candidatus Aphodomonas merdavium]
MANKSADAQVLDSRSFVQKLMAGSFIYTLISILIGFAIGAVALLIADYNPLVAYGSLFSVIFSSTKTMSYCFVEYATPYILTGLSVAFSFKTGMFNIGAEGQYVMGAVAAMLVGVFVKLPGVLLVPLCILAAIAVGVVWGGLVGYLKVRFGSHEVLCMIMFNWIAYYFSNYIVNHPGVNVGGGKTWSLPIQDEAKITISQWFGKNVVSTNTHFGIFIAIACVLAMYYIINKTTFGFRLKAVGSNRSCAEYAGINANRCVILSLAISGALAALAGGLQVLGVTYKINQFATQESYGFNGITVALIGATNPIGVLLGGWFFGAMKYAGTRIKMLDGSRVPKEIIDIIMGCIVLAIATSNLLRMAVVRHEMKGGKV